MLIYNPNWANKINAHILWPFFYFMNIIFQINGGLGKSVMATSICKSIKFKYPESDLIVVTGYPEVFINNPNVYKCFNFNEIKYFYRDFIEGKDFLYFGQEPYQADEYIKGDTHIIDIWAKLYNLPILQYNGELFLSQREIEFYVKKHELGGNILALQTSGASDGILYNWGRDIPPSFVNQIIKKNQEYKIYHIKLENQITYDGTIPFTDNIRAVAVLLAISKKRVLMDSSCQHIASALNLNSTVLWVTTKPKVFGYEFNNNLIANKGTKHTQLSSAYLRRYELSPSIVDFPYNNESEIFNEETLNLI